MTTEQLIALAAAPAVIYGGIVGLKLALHALGKILEGILYILFVPAATVCEKIGEYFSNRREERHAYNAPTGLVEEPAVRYI